MVIEEMLGCLRIDGWCVVPDVIPQDQIAPIRKIVEETTYAHGIKTRADGVAACKGLLAFDQSFAPCLADERILGIAEALFGPHVRISFSTTHINLPGNAHGGWHADWPFNQNNAGHIPAPYPDVVMHLTDDMDALAIHYRDGSYLNRARQPPSKQQSHRKQRGQSPRTVSGGDAGYRQCWECIDVRQPDVARGSSELQ